MKHYPFLDLKTVNNLLLPEIEDAVLRVVRSGRYIGGEEVSGFEKELAQLVESPYAVGVSNGLDALRLIFRAYVQLGILNKGDGVIVPPHTYIASVLAITDAGLKPVFVDASIETMNMDTSKLEEVYSPCVKAILTVHLYGRPCYDENLVSFVNKHGLILVEDNAQAIGATTVSGRLTGSLGHAAAFSFYPTKNIGAIGDAGAVTTDNEELAITVRALANYGSTQRYHNVFQGFNCRLDPIQAAVLRCKIGTINTENERRRLIAAVYNKWMQNPRVVKPLILQPDNCVWHQYAILVENRDKFREYLLTHGVETDVNYPTPVHLQPCYKEYAKYSFPNAERISREVVCLPVSAFTSADDAKDISTIINSYEP